MDSKKYNEQRYNRKKQKYRFLLGVQQLSNYPILNLIWVIFAIGIIFCAEVEKKYVQNVKKLRKSPKKCDFLFIFLVIYIKIRFDDMYFVDYCSEFVV